MIWSSLFILNALLYLLLMLWYRRGLYLLEQKIPDNGQEPGISVVVAARNEASDLPRLLQALRQQDNTGFEYEVLLIDDCSSDSTASLIFAAAGADPRFRALSTKNTSRGKKEAITLGVAAARFPLVVICDADSQPGQQWLKTLRRAFTPITGMVLGVTRLTADSTMLSRILQVEYAGILGIGLATAALGVPLFASGSNLAFRREAFNEVGGYRGIEQIRSGDDTFLIQRINQLTSWEIVPLLAAAARVDSRAPAGFGQLLSQRARWSSTQFRVPDLRLTLVGLNAYLLVSSVLVIGVCGLFAPHYFALAGLLLLIKILAETGFLKHSNRLQGLHISWYLILLGQFWELLYIPLSPLLGLTGLFRWRQR
ncbi:MAG: glycosyltransferase [Candidatus Delongbacteria bacterium]|nr:glycosyltransferase [Candidatus Delongbacteria bacterium]